MRPHPQLGEAPHLGHDPGLVGELGVRLAAPQRQGLPQHRRRADGIVGQPGAALREQRLEPGDVERLVGDDQHVAGRPGEER